VSNISGEALIALYGKGKRRILVGCAPCQPFSSHTNKIKNKTNISEEDNRWKLLYEFQRLIKETQPEIISMENVPQLIKHIVFDDFVESLKKEGYHISDYRKPIYCPDYGVPQKRQRLVLLASKLGEIKLIPPTHTTYITVEDVLKDLPAIKDGETDSKDSLHRSRKLSPMNLRRVQALKEGKTWTSFEDSDLIAPCHKSENGKKFTGVYGRMSWKEVAPTITTHCIGLSNGCFGHPEQDRAISLREAALLQSFPKDYEFIAPLDSSNMTSLARHIGNAVPPKLGEAIAKSIELHINQFVK
jgi:DNA (cytosine-5)-methyltransferase 1